MIKKLPLSQEVSSKNLSLQFAILELTMSQVLHGFIDVVHDGVATFAK